MSEALKKLKALLDQADEEEQADDKDARIAELEAQVKERDERIAAQAEQITEHEAIFTRVADTLENLAPGGMDESEHDEDAGGDDGGSAEEQDEMTELEAAQARIAELEAAQGETQTQRQQAPARQSRRARTPSGRPTGRATPNIEGMTLEERAKWVDDVLDPADRAGRQV